MKKILFLAFLFLVQFAFSQNHIYSKKGVAIEGYDVVAYFNGEAIKGDKSFSVTHQKTTYYFSSEENQKKFLKSPTAYLPQYGGFCAYAIAKNGEQVSVNPKTFLIEDGKLYLFYNSWGVNTLDKWNEENPKNLQEKADAMWKILVEN